MSYHPALACPMPDPAENVSTIPRCGVCGAAVPAAAPGGQCPRCLLSLGSASSLTATLGDALLDAGQVRSFGSYELLEEIARGGMGVVYRARQRELGREVAIKMILTGQLATAESVQRFRNEAATAARLDHPNIVSIHEIGEYETQHYFSMRLVLGRRNIANWAANLTGSQFERTRRIAAMLAKAARAVAFAHERGVLHRDLKPANILIDEKDEPQITDFGLAKSMLEADSGLTLSAALLGSPSYMAPEQADGRHHDVTTATDIYGLGAVLYEMLAGRPPFLAASPLVTARMVVEQMPARLAGVARDLETICVKCLAKIPAQRYATALALAEDCERFASGRPIRARPLTTAEALWRWARRRPKIAALLATLALAFVVGFAGVTWQWRRAEKARVAEARAVERLRWEQIARQASTEEAPVALAKLAALLRTKPDRWQAAMLAMSIVDQNPFPVLAGPPVLPDVPLIKPPVLAPDGRWFAAAAADASVRVWDVETGKQRASIAVAAPVTALAVGGGPLALAVATPDGKVTVYARPDAAGTPLTRAGGEPVDELRFSADGSLLIARSKDRVEMWACSAPERPPLAVQLDGAVLGCAVSADGTRVLAWTSKRGAVWDTATGREISAMDAQDEFKEGSLAASGKRFALVDGPYAARVWDIDSGKGLAPLDHPFTTVLTAVLNADGTRITLRGNANNLVVHDTASGLAVSLPMRHHYQPRSLIASGDGRRLVSQGWDGRACVWDATSGRSVLGAIWMETGLSPTAVDVSRDGDAVLLFPEKIGGEPGTISVWRGTRTQPPQRHVVEGSRDLSGNRLSPDGRLGCMSLGPHLNGQPGPIHGTQVYELATGRAVLTALTEGDVYLHLFSPDMRRYYALTENGWLYGWSLETGAPLWPPSQQPGFIRPAEISPDGTRIIGGYTDGHIRVHDTATGKVVQTLDDPAETRVLRFAPDGSGRFLVASNKGDVSIWQLQTGKKLHTLTGHTLGVICGGWSPDGRLVATGSYDRTVRVWEAATGKPVGQPMQQLAGTSHLEFSPDGRRLLTGSRDATARLWNPFTGEPLSPPLPQASTVLTVRFTRDGACFFVRDHLGFQFWDTEKAEPITVHFPEPMGSGLGMDSEPWRAIMSADGTLVHLGMSMNETVLWTVAQPRHPVPAWFPDFLEGLALMRLDSTDSTRISSGDGMLAVKERLRTASDQDPYAAWARRVLGEQR